MCAYRKNKIRISFKQSMHFVFSKSALRFHRNGIHEKTRATTMIYH